MGSLRDGTWLSAARARAVAAASLVVSIGMVAWLFLTANGTLDAHGRPLGTDFSQVYAAGRMALHGDAAKVWDWPSHFAVQQALHGSARVELYAWHYPPPFLLIAALLATLSYLPALIAWQAATLLPLTIAAQRFLGRRDGWLFVVGAPVTLICLTHGHNGFLTALLLGGGLLLLEKRPLLAGLLLGCLIYKPQFGLLLPLLLLVSRNWRAILGAGCSALILVALTLAIWGWPVWQAFIDSLPLTRHIVVEQGRAGWFKIMSPFAAMRGWGANIAAAYAVQAVFTVGAIGATLWLALRSRPALRNAAATAAALIATPYVLDYDFVVLLAGIGFLFKDGEEHGWKTWDRTLLAFAWIAPLLARTTALWTTIPLGLMSALAVLAVALLRASPSRR